jgi:hypothetical protein
MNDSSGTSIAPTSQTAPVNLVDAWDEKRRTAKKAQPKQLRGLVASKNRSYNQKNPFDIICMINPDVMQNPLRDHRFGLWKNSNKKINPIQTSPVGKEAYYAAAPFFSYSFGFDNAVRNKFHDFAAGLTPQPNWRSYTAKQKLEFMRQTNRELWTSIDPQQELVKAKHMDFKKSKVPEKSFPMILDWIGSYDPSAEKSLIPALSELEYVPDENLAIAFHDVLEKYHKGLSLGNYSGGAEHVIRVDLSRSILFNFYKENIIRRDEVHEYHIKRTEEFLHDRLGLQKKKMAKLSERLRVERCNDWQYHLVQETDHDFVEDMDTFFHEEAHCVTELSALYYERKGFAPLNFTQNDYELTKLALVNYVQPKENNLYYGINNYERLARNVASAATSGLVL